MILQYLQSTCSFLFPFLQDHYACTHTHILVDGQLIPTCLHVCMHVFLRSGAWPSPCPWQGCHSGWEGGVLDYRYRCFCWDSGTVECRYLCCTRVLAVLSADIMFFQDPALLEWRHHRFCKDSDILPADTFVFTITERFTPRIIVDKHFFLVKDKCPRVQFNLRQGSN